MDESEEAQRGGAGLLSWRRRSGEQVVEEEEGEGRAHCGPGDVPVAEVAYYRAADVHDGVRLDSFELDVLHHHQPGAAPLPPHHYQPQQLPPNASGGGNLSARLSTALRSARGGRQQARRCRICLCSRRASLQCTPRGAGYFSGGSDRADHSDYDEEEAEFLGLPPPPTTPRHGLLSLACKCKGENGFVHRLCAARWFAQKRSNACEVCGAPAFTFYPPPAPPPAAAAAHSASVEKLHVAIALLIGFAHTYPSPALLPAPTGSAGASLGTSDSQLAVALLQFGDDAAIRGLTRDSDAMRVLQDLRAQEAADLERRRAVHSDAMRYRHVVSPRGQPRRGRARAARPVQDDLSTTCDVCAVCWCLTAFITSTSFFAVALVVVLLYT